MPAVFRIVAALKSNMNMKHHSLFLSTVSIIFFGSILVGCRATFVSGSPASGTGSTAQTSEPVVMVREQPKVVVVNQPVRVREARPTIQPVTPAATAKQWAPLAITASSADVVKQYTDGRKYIKSKNGYFYWKGYDHRWYMEENDLKKVSYTDEEYIDWTTKGKKQSNSIADANGDKNTANQPGNSAFGHSRGNRGKVENPEKEKNPNHANGLTNAGANEDKNTAGQPGNSAFGHSRGNRDKVEKLEKEKKANHANGLTKEKEEKEHIEKEAKDIKDREEKLFKEKEEKQRIEKDVKDKKDREEKLVREKEEKERIEKEVKDKKDREEKLFKEKVQKEHIKKGVKDKKDQDKSADDPVKEKAPKA